MNEEEKLIEGQYWHQDRHDKTHTHHSMNGFLGVFNIGEIRKSKNSNGVFIYISFSNKVIWSSCIYNNWISGTKYIVGPKGLHDKNYESLIKKITKA